MVLLENQEKSTKTLIKKYFITVYWWRIFINNVWWKQLWKLKKNYVSIFGVSPTNKNIDESFVTVFQRKFNMTTLLNTTLANISFFLSIFNKKNSPPSLFQTSTNLSHHNLPVQHLLQGLSFPPMVRCLVKL
jgi:hypothetical protein